MTESARDQARVLKEAVAILDDLGIAYMVTGSTALNFYAVPRMTRDIDLVIELQTDQIDPLVNALSERFYVDAEDVRSAFAEPGLFNALHNQLVVKVDFVVRKDSPFRREEFRRRRTSRFGDMNLALVSAEDLLLSKLVWSKESQSELQLQDARNLAGSGGNLDWDYIERWAKDLSVSELLEKVRP